MNHLPLVLRLALCSVVLAPLTTAQSGTATSYSPGSSAGLQGEIEPALARLLAATPAFDNHAHPVLSPPDDATDRDFDALPVDSMALQSDPVALRPDFAPLHDAWQALYGVDLTPPLSPAASKELEAARNRLKARESEHYSAHILDRAGIGTMVANRVGMGHGVKPPRFLWVPYVDALLFPVDTSALARETPDRALFFPLEDKQRARYLSEAGLPQMPDTLDDYLARVVIPALQRQHDRGAIAVKFELAYLRALNIGNPTRAEAAAAYARGRAGTLLQPTAYKPLTDYLFRAIALECGRLGMAVHFHGMAGAGSYFSIAGVNPLNLEPLLNDPALRKTNFVMLHGGWPFVREAGALLQKPNVYLDISQQALVIPAHTLAGWLREWLEWEPEKVLFATDAYPYASGLGWEESAWLGSRNARQALGLALTGMLHDGEITPERAEALAHMVLHGNAEALYGKKTAPLGPR